MSNENERDVSTQDVPPADGTTANPATAAEELIASDWTREQVDEWRAKAAKSDDHWDRLLRLSADFDNYKKRAARERQEAIRFANAGLLEKLVPILDNFEAALSAANQSAAGTSDALKTGVSMIYSQLRSVLAEGGLEEIDATGQAFDPNWHEAVAQQASTEVPEGHVLQQVRKGYKLKERLIRPASVVVAKSASA